MGLTEKDLLAIKAHLQPLLGQPAWGIKLGEGTFVTMEFGPKIIKAQKGKTHGEWHLWVYFCAWRLEDEENVIVASEDSREQMSMALQVIEGKKLLSVEMSLPGLDTVFRFEKVSLRAFPVTSEENCAWMLYDPKEMVLEIGPGSAWKYISMHSAE
jgi:hypothetical protein